MNYIFELEFNVCVTIWDLIYFLLFSLGENTRIHGIMLFFLFVIFLMV